MKRTKTENRVALQKNFAGESWQKYQIEKEEDRQTRNKKEKAFLVNENRLCTKEKSNAKTKPVVWLIKTFPNVEGEFHKTTKWSIQYEDGIWINEAQ